MSHDESEPPSDKGVSGIRRSIYLAEKQMIRAVFEEDVSLGESIINDLLVGDEKTVSDMAFSFALRADQEETIGFCVDLLIYAGFFSFEADYWCNDGNSVEFDEIFDSRDDVPEPQRHLRKWVAEKQSAQNEFGEFYDLKPAIKNTHAIFKEVEKYLCDNGQLFRPTWYAARIMREFTASGEGGSLFLIGVLWEQLRQKITHSVELMKRQEQVERLRGQSGKATETLIKRSEDWKAHCEVMAQEILAQDQRKYGNWSAIGGQILSAVERMPHDSKIRRSYLGKRSKNKPQGTELIDVATVARFLSGRLKT
ncbi:hypothetical protein [uncultured Roseobacter sp.]|uniref:hypothetical protein n=1 Tax=uncultured Roseobacter sp. TaxID=114847 RepID=UPI00261F0A3D|nr:hypothetical protein [uncultured Roseobacter sp.]